jgi:hypothetical protein
MRRPLHAVLVMSTVAFASFTVDPRLRIDRAVAAR